MRLKPAGGNLYTRVAQPPGEVAIQAFRFFSGRGIGEGRTVAFDAVGVERELRYDEQLAADLENGSIHFILMIFEDSQVLDLFSEIVGIAVAIMLADTQQDAKAATDLTDDNTVD